MGNKPGRPLIWGDDKIKRIIEKMGAYAEESDIPILAEFAYLNKLNRTQLYEYPQLTDAIKNLIAKKEAQLEKLGLFNVISSSVAIFSLKQLGWSDKQELQHTINTDAYDQLKALYDK